MGALLAKALKSVPAEDGTDVAVAVLDMDSGDSAVYGDGAFIPKDTSHANGYRLITAYSSNSTPTTARTTTVCALT